MITFAELESRVSEILPGASFERDNEGQIVIYTNLIEIEDGVVQDMDEVAEILEADKPCWCGSYPGDPHNNEAHLAEMRASEYEKYETYDDDFAPYYEEEIHEDKCWEINKHRMNTSGRTFLFGPNADVLVFMDENCDDCGFELTCDWMPKGYNLREERMVIYREEYTRTGVRHLWSDESLFAVYEKAA